MIENRAYYFKRLDEQSTGRTQCNTKICDLFHVNALTSSQVEFPLEIPSQLKPHVDICRQLTSHQAFHGACHIHFIFWPVSHTMPMMLRDWQIGGGGGEGGGRGINKFLGVFFWFVFGLFCFVFALKGLSPPPPPS